MFGRGVKKNTKKPKKSPTRGQEGSPNFVLPQIFLPMKILEPYHNSFWEKSNNLGKKKRKNAINSGHLVP